jgi:hypothetical protein
MKIHPKKPFDYIINIYYKFQSFWIKFTTISEIEFNCFQINFMLELFMCLRLELLKLFWNFYSLKIIYIFQISDPNLNTLYRVQIGFPIIN